jgi:hypothetical protein
MRDPAVHLAGKQVLIDEHCNKLFREEWVATGSTRDR